VALAHRFANSTEASLEDGRCLMDRMTIVRYMNFLLSDKGLPGRVLVLGGHLVYKTPSLTLEMTTDVVLKRLAPSITTNEQVLLTLEKAGQAFLAQIETMLPANAGDFSRDKILLYLMHESQVRSLEKSLRERKPGVPEHDMPVVFRQYGSMYLSPAIVADGRKIPVTEAICKVLGVHKNDIFDIGHETLVQERPPEARTFKNGVNSIRDDDLPASALFFLGAFWDQVADRIGGNPVVRVTNGDLINFVKEGDRDAALAIGVGLDTMVKLGHQSVIVSDVLFRWDGSTFKPMTI
jgi:hypothetical protein